MPDRIRVIRIIEYVGPREWVERTVAKSIHGTREFPGPRRLYHDEREPGGKITAITLGDFPESLAEAVGVPAYAEDEP
jgi:hypothetical protein